MSTNLERRDDKEGWCEAYVEYVERQRDAGNEVGGSFRHILWKKA
jgi:hypothetical protein